jgi:hypothetical protein
LSHPSAKSRWMIPAWLEWSLSLCPVLHCLSRLCCLLPRWEISRRWRASSHGDCIWCVGWHFFELPLSLWISWYVVRKKIVNVLRWTTEGINPTYIKRPSGCVPATPLARKWDDKRSLWFLAFKKGTIPISSPLTARSLLHLPNSQMQVQSQVCQYGQCAIKISQRINGHSRRAKLSITLTQNVCLIAPQQVYRLQVFTSCPWPRMCTIHHLKVNIVRNEAR